MKGKSRCRFDVKDFVIFVINLGEDNDKNLLFHADSITRDRIDYLLSILHLHDNMIEQDKGEKIQPLINLFNERCLITVKPETNISIDEQIIGYRGKSAPKSFKQYMPNKPTKRGFKFWAKCGVSGFVYEVKLYRGAAEIVSKENTSISLQRSLRSTIKTTTSMVVLDFFKHVPVGSRIFVNNYFSSFNLNLSRKWLILVMVLLARYVPIVLTNVLYHQKIK